MADLGFERRCRLLGRREAGAAAAVRRQEARQVREAGDISLAIRNTAIAAACDSASPRPSKASASAVVSKLTVEIIAPSCDQHRRAVAGAVEVGLDGAPRRARAARRPRRHRCEAAKRQRVLHPPRLRRARTGRCRRAAGSSVSDASAWPGAGRSATARGSIGERLAPEAFERERAGRDQRFERQLARHAASARRARSLCALAFSSAMASFGPSAGHRDAGQPQRLGARA